MALTITVPQDYVRVYDTASAIYTINSTNFYQTNFRLLVELNRYGLTGTSYQNIVSLAYYTDSGGTLYFNPCDILKHTLTTDININATTNTAASNSHIRFGIKVTEQYGDPITNYTTGESYGIIGYNGIQMYEGYDFSYGINHYIMRNLTGSSTAVLSDFLTDVRNFYLAESEKLFLYYLIDNATPTTGNTYLQTKYYTSAAAATATTTTHTLLSMNNNYMYYFPAGPDNISGYTSCYKYTMQLTDWDGIVDIAETGKTYFSNIYTVYIQGGALGNQAGAKTNTMGWGTSCNSTYNTSTLGTGVANGDDGYDFCSLFWLNQHGGWSNLLFNRKNTKSYEIDRNFLNKRLLPNYTTPSSFRPDRGRTQYYATQVETITLNTNFLRDEESILFKSLFLSSDVRLLETINGVDYLIPVIVITEKFEQKTKNNDGLYSYEIQIQRSTQKQLQYG
jgi:hypothetical protein